MARIIPFCSSSRGNSVYIGNKTSGVLIDAGCSYKQLCCYMEINGIGIEAVKAVLITHEHSDHVKGLAQLTKRTGVPVFASAGTARELANSGYVSYNSELFDISELDRIHSDYLIKAFHTSHDSAESVGYTLVNEKEGIKIGYCTDTGTVTDCIKSNLHGADFVFLESNYEPALLRSNTRYPVYIKRRIASDVGHLSNPDCALFLKDLIIHGTTRIILGHLSEENNTRELAYKNAVETLSAAGMKEGYDYTLDIAPVSGAGNAAAI